MINSFKCKEMAWVVINQSINFNLKEKKDEKISFGVDVDFWF
jgi:hypothetical protein